MKKEIAETKIYPLRISEKEIRALARIDVHVSKIMPGIKNSIRDLIKISIFFYDEYIQKMEKNK